MELCEEVVLGPHGQDPPLRHCDVDIVAPDDLRLVHCLDGVHYATLLKALSQVHLQL